jgi:hypothetical protein
MHSNLGKWVQLYVYFCVMFQVTVAVTVEICIFRDVMSFGWLGPNAPEEPAAIILRTED